MWGKPWISPWMENLPDFSRQSGIQSETSQMLSFNANVFIHTTTIMAINKLCTLSVGNIYKIRGIYVDARAKPQNISGRIYHSLIHT